MPSFTSSRPHPGDGPGLEARLRARGATQVNLLVFAENRDALAFWRECGYRSMAPVVLLTRRVDDPSA
ncbi:MAG: hypothetical protein BRC31_03895 [Actinobacteria bacterium QS_5_72_10]|nr:MAG: hypothetical protein BRC31_03895 [Actinobacteria bacterium QS_5_72_10]